VIDKFGFTKKFVPPSTGFLGPGVRFSVRSNSPSSHFDATISSLLQIDQRHPICIDTSASGYRRSSVSFVAVVEETPH
jgi:hypothetical protein